MTLQRAVRLIQKAVDFYIQQNYEFDANCYQLGYDQAGISRDAFEKRAELREAMEMACQRILGTD